MFFCGFKSGQSSDVYLDRSDIGNINNVQTNGSNALRNYSNAHELTSVDGTSQSFDSDGNLTSSHTGVSLTWDSANRLSSTTLSGSTGTYKYDADNRRVQKQVTGSGASNTVYIYAGPNCIAEYTFGTSPNSPGNEYVYAGQIDSLVMLARNNNASRHGVTRNQQWSITALTNLVNGTVQERYTYDHFGNRTILAPTALPSAPPPTTLTLTDTLPEDTTTSPA